MKKFTHGRPVPQFYTELVQLCNFNKFQFADMSVLQGVSNFECIPGLIQDSKRTHT